jgi:hypothetical protein
MEFFKPHVDQGGVNNYSIVMGIRTYVDLLSNPGRISTDLVCTLSEKMGKFLGASFKDIEMPRTKRYYHLYIPFK